MIKCKKIVYFFILFSHLFSEINFNNIKLFDGCTDPAACNYNINEDVDDISEPLLPQEREDLTENGTLNYSSIVKEKDHSIPIQIIKNANISKIETIRCSLTQTTQV